jgi:hypothetical protein
VTSSLASIAVCPPGSANDTVEHEVVATTIEYTPALASAMMRWYVTSSRSSSPPRTPPLVQQTPCRWHSVAEKRCSTCLAAVPTAASEARCALWSRRAFASTRAATESRWLLPGGPRAASCRLRPRATPAASTDSRDARARPETFACDALHWTPNSAAMVNAERFGLAWSTS